jgi:hypothetical protein
MRNIVFGSVALLICVGTAAPAQADYVFQLTDAEGVEQNHFVIGSIGRMIDVNVYLRQSDPDALLTEEGLYSAGVRLTYGSPGIAEVLSVDNTAPNLAFDDPIALLKEVGSNYIALDMAVSDIFSPVFPQSSTPDRIWLGTFTFTGLSLGSVQITAMDNPDMDNTLTGLSTVLDSRIGSAQATISTVPEPSGLILLAGVALLAGPYLWRHCRHGA